MNNLLDLIRMNNIFGGGNPVSTGAATPPFIPTSSSNIFGDQTRTAKTPLFEQEPLTDAVTKASVGNNEIGTLGREQEIINMINSLYKPESRYSDMYEQELANQPKREKRSVGRKIAGSILGFLSGSPETAMRFTYPDYYGAMPEWKERMNRLEPLMREERAGNQASRQIATSSANAIIADRRLAETERSNKVKEENAAKKLELDRIKAAGWKLKTGEDGYIYAISSDGSQERRTNVKSGELSESEKIALQLDSALQQIGARGEIQTAINDADNATAREIANLRADTQAEVTRLRAELAGQNKWTAPVQAFDKEGKPLDYMISTNGVTGEFKKIPLDGNTVVRNVAPGSSSNNDPNSMSETQKKQLKINRANEIINKYPQLKSYINIKSDGVNVASVNTGTAVGRIFGGTYGNLDAETRQKMVDYIDGKTNVFELPTPKTKTNPTAGTANRGNDTGVKAKPVIPPGEVLIRKDGKNVGTIKNDPAQIAEAKRQGYEVVK